MVQLEQTKVVQLTAIASQLVQVQGSINAFSSAFTADDWQWQKLADIAESLDDYINEVALMIGHETLAALTIADYAKRLQAKKNA